MFLEGMGRKEPGGGRIPLPDLSLVSGTVAQVLSACWTPQLGVFAVCCLLLGLRFLTVRLGGGQGLTSDQPAAA